MAWLAHMTLLATHHRKKNKSNRPDNSSKRRILTKRSSLSSNAVSPILTAVKNQSENRLMPPPSDERGS